MIVARLRARIAALNARIHWTAIFAALPTIAGLITDPDMLGWLPKAAARALTVIGIVLQMTTKAVQARHTIMQPPDPPGTPPTP